MDQTNQQFQMMFMYLITYFRSNCKGSLKFLFCFHLVSSQYLPQLQNFIQYLFIFLVYPAI